jgi:hypothetical protein
MPTDLVWVALIAALGPIIGFFAKPVVDAVSRWLESGSRKREQQAASIAAAQDAMAEAMRLHAIARYQDDVLTARGHALAIRPLAERVSDPDAREALKAFVTKAAVTADVDEIRRAYDAANEAMGAASRR